MVRKYGPEFRTSKKRTTVEMDYLRKSCTISRLERKIKRMNERETVVDKIERRALKWFERLLRMSEERWSKKSFSEKGNVVDFTDHGMRTIKELWLT